MIGFGADAETLQRFGQFLDAIARQTINNAAFIAAFLDEPDQAVLPTGFRRDIVKNIGPVKGVFKQRVIIK